MNTGPWQVGFVIVLALSASHAQAEPPAVLPSQGAVTNILGQRVTLSYGMPISEAGARGHLPRPDAVTRCYVEGKDRKAREFTLPWKLDEFSVVVPKELAPFRNEHFVQKGTRRALYEPTGDLLRKRLSIILDSQEKLREIDFHGGLRIDLKAKTITVLLSDETEQKAGEQQGAADADKPRASTGVLPNK